MNKPPRIVLVAGIGVALLAAGLAGYAWWARGHDTGGPLTLYGNVDIREVEMAFRQPGRVAAVAVDEGAAVRRGALLAELDPQPFQDAIAAAQAERARAHAELDKLRRGSRTQEVAQADAAVRQAEAAARQADSEWNRQSGLLAAGATSQKAVDAARSNRDQAQAALASARQGLSLRQEGSRREDIAAGEARVAAAEAALAQAQTALADTRLLAPADGVVSTRVREPGSMAAAGAPVLTLSLQDPVYVRAYASEPQLPQLAPGTAVTVRADGTAEAFAGVVGFVSPRAEFTPKSVETADLRTDLVYRLRIVLPGAARALRQGMPVTVQVGSGGGPGAGVGAGAGKS